MTDFTNMTPEERRTFWATDRAAADKRTKEYTPTDKVDALCHAASVNATQWATDDGLYPKFFTEWNEPRYTAQQGLRAAHVGREDSAATLILMRPVLRYLTNIVGLMWVLIALMAIILWRVW